MEVEFIFEGQGAVANVFKLNQDMMRLSLTNPISKDEFRIVYADGEVSRYLEGGLGLIEIEGAQDLTATDLFDLVVLTPEYHFNRVQADQFNDENPVWEGYEFVLLRAPTRKGVHGFRPPLRAELYRVAKDAAVRVLVRSADYYAADSFGNAFDVASKIVFTDVETDEETTVLIRAVDYNVGVTHFMFGLPTPKAVR